MRAVEQLTSRQGSFVCHSPNAAHPQKDERRVYLDADAHHRRQLRVVPQRHGPCSHRQCCERSECEAAVLPPRAALRCGQRAPPAAAATAEGGPVKRPAAGPLGARRRLLPVWLPLLQCPGQPRFSRALASSMSVRVKLLKSSNHLLQQSFKLLAPELVAERHAARQCVAGLASLRNPLPALRSALQTLRFRPALRR